MLQLAYLSQSTEANPDVRALAEQSSPRNAAEEITGVLLHRDGHYLQVLEGPKAVVEDAFLRIMSDVRHGGLQLLSRRMIAGRQFGSWSMAAIQDRKNEDDAIAHVRQLMAEAPYELRAAFETKFGTMLT
jgi:hypothetical protein